MLPRKDGGRRAALLLTLTVASALGCGVRHEPPASSARPPSAADLISARDQARLDAIAAARAASATDGGYRIGPDDLLDIRIPDLMEAQAGAGAHAGQGTGDVPTVAGTPAFQQGLRVNAKGDVVIPMLGTVHAAGKTPTELEEEIAWRLVEGDILRTPQVTVLVAEYRSRVVAVIGSVERPGLYPLTRPGATLADMVWAAGGPNRDAGRVVEFTPAAEMPAAAGAEDRTPIHLDLELLLHPAARDGITREVRARPGDVVSVAPAGSVLVDGWVEKPGSYPVTRGLTVTGAVAAAGGAIFAANRHHAVVKRVFGSGEDRFFVVDLEAVSHGEAPDMPVTDGDVVKLPASTGRVIPWGVWTIAREMVHVGGNVLLF